MFLNLTTYDGRRLRVALDKITSYSESGSGFNGKSVVTFEEGNTNPSFAEVADSIDDIDAQIAKMTAITELQ